MRRKILRFNMGAPTENVWGRRPRKGDDTEPTTVRRKYTKRFNPVSKGLDRRGKRTMSEEGKKRVAEAQRKRWAATKKEAK
jgi:hypothetical protein